MGFHFGRLPFWSSSILGEAVFHFRTQPSGPKIKDGLTQNGRRPKWKTTKMEDDQNGRRPKWKADQNGRRPKWKTTKMEDDQNARRPKWKTTKMEDDQNGRQPKNEDNHPLRVSI